MIMLIAFLLPDYTYWLDNFSKLLCGWFNKILQLFCGGILHVLKAMSVKQFQDELSLKNSFHLKRNSSVDTIYWLFLKKRPLQNTVRPPLT